MGGSKIRHCSRFQGTAAFSSHLKFSLAASLLTWLWFASLFTLVSLNMKRATQWPPKCLISTLRDVKAVCQGASHNTVNFVTFCTLWCVSEHSFLASAVLYKPSHLTGESKGGEQHSQALSFSVQLPAETPWGKHHIPQQLVGQC